VSTDHFRDGLKFEVNRLASDELSYELEIRGIVGLATVAEMRKTLRNLLRLEKSPTPLTYPDHPYTFEEDVTAVAQKLDEIGGLVESFEGVRDATYAKIISKIAHALGRVNKSRATEAAEESRKSRLIVSLLNLHSTANSKARKVTKLRARMMMWMEPWELQSLREPRLVPPCSVHRRYRFLSGM
jgi:3-polyprenyl-4-hydroxybenzoate decarboxylase